MNNLAVLDNTSLGPHPHFPPIADQFWQIHIDSCRKEKEGGWRAQVYLLSLPESEVLPQEQRKLRQETHYGFSWQYRASASRWQLAHLLNPGGNKKGRVWF